MDGYKYKKIMNLRFYGEHIDKEVKNPAFYKKLKMNNTAGEGGFAMTQSVNNMGDEMSIQNGQMNQSSMSWSNNNFHVKQTMR